ncbi:E3 ubiquitin-protein ligase [Tetrabaena socialis]|uniref:E3 ubiquitin-protein ligase n=1 Tax=Tetrabaena socialis TaxID=47790 RepID=A0A2J8AI72_9CHLO|nr:E3 ubiquitin-protein ligase [Tetrabaena socialis]|eukprot:PNH12223.1 E3 ubiquitin-protein ligase [Tetrabaena socialis]
MAAKQHLEQVVAALALQDVRGSSSSSQPTAAAASPPDDFNCPITLCVMRNPVTVESGHAFERQAITEHLAVSNTNPVTNEPLQTKALTPAINLRNIIKSWLDAHGMTYDQADAAAEGMQTDEAQPPPTQPNPPASPTQPTPERSDLALRPARTADERALLNAAVSGTLREVMRLLSDPADNPNVQDPLAAPPPPEDGCEPHLLRGEY